MKKCLAILLLICVCLGVAGCRPANVALQGMESDVPDAFAATQSDIDYLNGKYAGRVAYFGDLHDHSKDADYIINDKATKAYADEWIAAMDELDMDFQALVNHKQVYHMYVDEWDNTRLIGGSEPATKIIDSKATDKSMHYNMIVPTPEDLIEVLQSVPKFAYTGGKNGVALEQGTFQYANFTTAEMQDIIQKIKDRGGIWVHVHPKQYMQSGDPLDYWFADYTGLEVFYIDYTNAYSKDNYNLWRQLLSMGKRVWATAGCDEHALPTAKTLNVVYSEKKDAATYLTHISQGDFTCGNVGIRMAIGDATMGGHTDFNGKRVVFSVGDFHSTIAGDKRQFSVQIIGGDGVVYKRNIDPTTTNCFAFDANENATYYRVEVYCGSTLIALGNPIWND